MNYSIVFSSRTGNTKMLAQALQEAIAGHGDSCIYFGAPDMAAAGADLILVGFWTDKGSCDETVAAFLKELHGKKVALFGTAGFGGDPDYFAKILGNASANLPQDNTLLDGFMCQGRMPQAVRDRYVAQKMDAMVANFDRALSHPDQQDLAAAARWLSGLQAKAAEK